MSGWVSVSRSMIKHHMFDGDVYSRRDAWLWLISKAAWKDTKHRVGGQVVNVPRGSLYATLRELAIEWKWKSDFKVRKFLTDLENDQMITRETTQGKTHITLCNYTIYQDVKQSDNAEINASATQEQRTKGTNKQINNTTLLSGRTQEFYDAVGVRDENMSPSLLSLSDPLHWVDSGCDIDMDILPTLKSISARGKTITSWAYCTKAIFQARDTRLSPSPDVVRPDFQNKKQLSGTDMLRMDASGEI